MSRRAELPTKGYVRLVRGCISHGTESRRPSQRAVRDQSASYRRLSGTELEPTETSW
ncbi:hypothetical protein NOCARDAX2BIS_520127 [Nocardioides sp. AX2bis]|nr:hypothetical protein NOCARDAX2BIS_520127 [Nocardioides sp. AX2bis]